MMGQIIFYALMFLVIGAGTGLSMFFQVRYVISQNEIHKMHCVKLNAEYTHVNALLY